MDNKILSMVIMQMLQERAERKSEEVRAELVTLKKLRNELNSPLSKADLQKSIDWKTRSIQGLDFLADYCTAYSKNEWENFLLKLDEMSRTNYDGYEAIMGVLTIDDSVGYIRQMWK